MPSCDTIAFDRDASLKIPALLLCTQLLKIITPHLYILVAGGMLGVLEKLLDIGELV